MPFGSIYRPSLQIGLLSAIARAAGARARTFHFVLDFAAQLGVEDYHRIILQGYNRGAVGDWLFAEAAFARSAPPIDDGFLARVCGSRVMGSNQLDPKRLRDVRESEVPVFIDRVHGSVDWSQFDVVGFTSTFEQTAASVALARRIKGDYPHVLILFGGANLQGEMGSELVRTVDVIDFAIDGEADESFPEFLKAVHAGLDPVGIPGVVACRDGRLVGESPEPFDRLDENPIPDFREYFERAEQLDLEPVSRASHDLWLPLETARGCWWGERRHCTFCGLNGQTMAFRSKSAERVIDEIRALSSEYGIFSFAATDNILDRKYLDTLFDRLERPSFNYQFFYEIKADLKPRELKQLRDAGVIRVQPGIESLSSHILKLMRKGTSAWQNVNLLRWCRYLGIRAEWNILCGFPGEEEDDYAEQAELASLLTHLEPPGSCRRVWLERFSPMFNDRSRFPGTKVEPKEHYRHVYPEGVELSRVAYFFDYDLDGTLRDDAYEDLRSVVRDWQVEWKPMGPASMTYRWNGECVVIKDQRLGRLPGEHKFRGELARLYHACSETALTAKTLFSELGVGSSAQDAEEALEEFRCRGLMMRDGNRYLALAIPDQAMAYELFYENRPAVP